MTPSPPSLLIATPVSMYLYDLGTGRLDDFGFGGGEYYGISWNADTVFIAHSNLDSAGMITDEDYRRSGVGTVTAYTASGARTICSGISQPHQVTWDARGRLLVTNTGFNGIVAIDPAADAPRAVRLGEHPFEVIGGQKVGNHFNSLFPHGDTLYVVAHNCGRKSEVWELDRETLAVRRVRTTETEWAHNLLICEHGMLVCDSRNGSLYDVQSGRTVWRADESPVITRGLAMTDDHLFVGRSEYGNRYTRRYSDGGFWVLDRRTLKTVERVVLPGTGCTNELRLIGAEDAAHPGVPAISREQLRVAEHLPAGCRLRRWWAVTSYRARNRTDWLRKSAAVRRASRLLTRLGGAR